MKEEKKERMKHKTCAFTEISCSNPRKVVVRIAMELAIKRATALELKSML
jgi:hypothetical protein